MQVGQVVKIKPQYCGAWEQDMLFVVRTPAEPGKPRVDISNLELIDWPLWPTHVELVDMLEATPFVLDMLP